MFNRSPVPVRAVMTLIGTVAGLALLLSFKTPDAPPLQAGAAGSPSAIIGQASPSQAPGGNGIGAVAPPPQGNGSGNDHPTPSVAAGSGPTPAPTGPAAPRGGTSAPTPAPTPAPTSAPVTADGTVDGPVIQTPYGDVQVEVKIQGGKIADVKALQLPTDRLRSAEISQYVGPILHDEVLHLQTWRINLISGATYTSIGYARSVQAALDQAHFNG